MSKRILPNLYITFDEGIGFDTLQQNETVRRVVYNNVFIGIQEAARKKHKNAVIVELNSSGNCVTLPRENWKASLEKAQGYFADLEDFETCIRIKKLIESLDSYGTKRIPSRTSETD